MRLIIAGLLVIGGGWRLWLWFGRFTAHKARPRPQPHRLSLNKVRRCLLIRPRLLPQKPHWKIHQKPPREGLAQDAGTSTTQATEAAEADSEIPACRRRCCRLRLCGLALTALLCLQAAAVRQQMCKFLNRTKLWPGQQSRLQGNGWR